MKQWVPLFQIFIISPSPEIDASLYFQQHHNPSTSSFLSLLLTPILSSQNQLFIQTLPFFVQSRILSFLLIESLRFCHRRLRSLACHILNSKLSSHLDGLDPSVFWVHRNALNLLDAVSSSESSICNALEDRHEYYDIPDWLKSSNTTTTALLHWLPMLKNPELSSMVFPDEPESEDILIELEEVDSCSPAAAFLDPQACERATFLKTKILASASSTEALHIAHEIRKLCFDSGPNNELALLGLIEPWQADDETLSVIIPNLLGDIGSSSCNWPAHVLCSISLPKLLNLRAPASRVLLSTTVSFCNLHPVAAVEALLFPLVLRKEGINIVLCDVLTRVVKECLHKSHVSSFCQKLLRGDRKDRRLVCLPYHQDLISDELVWTEPMFTLFQHILNHDVFLTPDSVDELVTVIVKVTDEFSASLKFGNFFLCFLTKCTRAVKFYKVVLEKAAERTDTFVTKSVILKLGGQ